MIVILGTRAHAYTHETLRDTGRFDLRTMPYDRALLSRYLPVATYVFTDMDRLGFWELELAARLYRSLRRAGQRVLNDPARVRDRFSLLRTLRERGINDFDAYRVEDERRPRRYPVFLRTESAHLGALSDLLHSPGEVDDAIRRATDRGVPRRGMLLVEYCAEPVREGVFRKLSVYRVGDRLVPAVGVHQSTWLVKHGEVGLAGQELYEDEYQIIVQNRHAAELRPVFELADTEYGRADFGLVAGRPQVYEINTNPCVGETRSHPFAIRSESSRVAHQLLLEALEAVDAAPGGRVKVEDPVLWQQRQYDRLVLRSHWCP